MVTKILTKKKTIVINMMLEVSFAIDLRVNIRVLHGVEMFLTAKFMITRNDLLGMLHFYFNCL